MGERMTLFALAGNKSFYFVSTFDIRQMAQNTVTRYNFYNRRIATYALSYLPATQMVALEDYLIVATDCITVFDLHTGNSRKYIHDSVFPLSWFKLVKIDSMYQLVAFSELKIYCLRFDEKMNEIGREMWPLFYPMKPGQSVVFVDSICNHRVYFAIYNIGLGSLVRFGATEQTLFGERQTAYVQPRTCYGQPGVAEWERFLSRKPGGTYAQDQTRQQNLQMAEYLTVDVENNLSFLQICYEEANPYACNANWIKCGAIPTEANRHVLKIEELSSGRMVVMDELSVYLCDMNSGQTTVLHTAASTGVIYNFHVLRHCSGRRESYHVVIAGLDLIKQVPLQ